MFALIYAGSFWRCCGRGRSGMVQSRLVCEELTDLMEDLQWPMWANKYRDGDQRP